MASEVALSVDDRVARALNNLKLQGPFPLRGAAEPEELFNRMTRYSVPGVSIALVDGFKVIWKGSFGVCSVNRPEPVTTQTLFQAGSISKPVFALAVMCLVEAGVLDLDEDVNVYLKSWRIPTNGKWAPRVTLRHLLSHTAATSVRGFPGYPRNRPWPTLIQVLNGDNPSNTPPIVIEGLPGIAFRYSGGGTTIAQQVVMDVLDKPFPELMRKIVFDPLGMDASTYEQPLPKEMMGSVANGHRWGGDPVIAGAYVYPEMAAAGLWTNAGEIAQLGSEFMRILHGEKSRISLTKDYAAAMLRPQLDHQRIGQDFVGIGWFCDGQGQSFRFGHNGEDNGFLAHMRMFPAQGAGAVVMVNSIQGGPVIFEVLSALEQEFGWLSTDGNAYQITHSLNRELMGTYKSKDGMIAIIENHGNSLSIRFDLQKRLDIFPIADGVFGSTSADFRLIFMRDDFGKPMRILFSQFGFDLILNRLE